MKELGYFAGLALALYIAHSLWGFVAAIALVAILVLVERSTTTASS
jgi:hypothetical protein